MHSKIDSINAIPCLLNLSSNEAQLTYDKGKVELKHSGPDIHMTIAIASRSTRFILFELEDAKKLLRMLAKEIKEAEYYTQSRRDG